jgi:hypothetical protein
MSDHFFVTVDAETEVIAEGIAAITRIRDRVEQDLGMPIPLFLLVRFQRGTTESVEPSDPAAFRAPPQRVFDGFALAGDALLGLAARGDEIGWHYHAYHYVHRDDLDYALKVQCLLADLASCAGELRRRYPEFTPRAFRFGWFFVPDPRAFTLLAELGFDVDASVRPTLSRPVRRFRAQYPPPLTDRIPRIGATWHFPFERSLLLHDTDMIAHRLSWCEQDEPQAEAARKRFTRRLRQIGSGLRNSGGRFLTYADWLRAHAAGSPA